MVIIDNMKAGEFYMKEDEWRSSIRIDKGDILAFLPEVIF